MYFEGEGKGGRAQFLPQGIRRPCRELRQKSALPLAHARWIPCRPWRHPEKKQCPLISNSNSSEWKFLKEKAPVRPECSKFSLVDFKLPIKLENQALRQEKKSRARRDGLASQIWLEAWTPLLLPPDAPFLPPGAWFWQQNYSIHALFLKLKQDRKLIFPEWKSSSNSEMPSRDKFLPSKRFTKKP